VATRRNCLRAEFLISDSQPDADVGENVWILPMTLAAAHSAARRTLRDKELGLVLTPTGNYQGPTTAVAAGAWTQSAAGQPLKLTIPVGDTLSGSVTFSTSGGTGAGTQAVNMATYSGLGSTTPATATAAAVALALALTSGALGTASGSTYTGSIANGVLSIATSKPAEVLSVTVSSLVFTNPAGGGDTVNLTAISVPLGVSDGAIGYPGKITEYQVLKFAGGYVAELVPGTTLANWLLRVYSAAGTELATGAYPAAILADTFLISLVGPKLRF
jgi:hypothetical protein